MCVCVFFLWLFFFFFGGGGGYCLEYPRVHPPYMHHSQQILIILSHTVDANENGPDISSLDIYY